MYSIGGSNFVNVDMLADRTHRKSHSKEDNMTLTDKDILVLVAVLNSVGCTLLDLFKVQGSEPVVLSQPCKGQGNLITIADILVDGAIQRFFATNYPSYGVISEHSIDTNSILDNDHIWLLDPLDGTVAFVEGRISECSIVLTLLTKAKDGYLPTVGILHHPKTRRTWIAQKNIGIQLFKSGKLFNKYCFNVINNYQEKRPFKINLLTSRSVHNELLCRCVNAIRCKKIQRKTGAVKILPLLDKSADVLIQPSPAREWDYAAPALLAMEAGHLIVSDCIGMPLKFNTKGHVSQFGWMVARAELYNQIIESIAPVVRSYNADANYH